MSKPQANWFDASFVLVLVFVFFNSVGLPHGLLYTTVLTPFLMFWLWRKRVYGYALWFTGISAVLTYIHLGHDVVLPQYAKSTVLLFTTLVFTVATWQFLRNTTRMGWYFKQILIFNTILLPVAAAAFLHPVTREWFWYLVPFSPNLPAIPRLKMLTYEASFYSLTLAPLAVFYVVKSAFGQVRYPLLVLLLVFVPLLLSLSLGVLIALSLALVGVLITYFRPIMQRKRFRLTVLYTAGGLVLGLLLLMVLWPDNPVFERIDNVLSHRDTSARGRTYEAFWLAGKLAWNTNIWVGAGPGQVKALGHDLFFEFYQITITGPYVARIPNSAAETLAVYGVLGLAVRLGIQGWLFIRYKVYRNLFSLGLFLFIFIYQFTGSYITSPLEYVIWILAVLPLFPEFHKSKLFPKA